MSTGVAMMPTAVSAPSTTIMSRTTTEQTPLRLRIRTGTVGQRERHDAGSGCPAPAIATVQQPHRGGDMRIGGGAVRL